MLHALYYDGQHAEAQPVELTWANACLQIAGAGDIPAFPAHRLMIRPAVGNIPCLVELPDGGMLEIADIEAARHFFGQQRSWIERLEAYWRFALLSVLATTATLAAVYLWGLPWAADRASALVPISWEQKLGSETLAALDEHWFAPSALPAQRQKELRELFTQQFTLPAHCCQLLFRKGGAIGANALALPGGTLVVTDDLVALAHDDEEILAVLAHEMGHIQGRHSVRMLLRASGVGVTFALLTGDVGTLGSVLASAPAVLMQLSYSREFEEEADASALRSLKAAGIAPCRFTDILNRLTKKSPSVPGLPRWLTTHPDTPQRTNSFGAGCPATPVIKL
ncbi:MAG: M48 family metallopeptidase [Formivibrio sp.]|nr:M48 family metallopeptidase [Formivibrio sp.]